MTVISPRPVVPGKTPAQDIWPGQGVFYNILRPLNLRDDSVCALVTGWEMGAHVKAATSSVWLPAEQPWGFPEKPGFILVFPTGLWVPKPINLLGIVQSLSISRGPELQVAEDSLFLFKEKFVIMNLLHSRHFCFFQEAALAHSPLIKQFHDFVLKIFKSWGE